MNKFEAKYSNPVYFGIWAEDDAPYQAKRDAWDVIMAHAKRTYIEDVRCKDLEDALAYLESKSVRDRPFKDFRKALEISEAEARRIAVKDALQRIWKGL